ncbi:hypothetical protein N2152v2_002740 [Parachlorella kessleri]
MHSLGVGGSPNLGVQVSADQVPFQLLAHAKATQLVGLGAPARPGSSLPEQLDVEEALADCRAALHGATATMLHAHAPDTVKRRQQHAAEAEAFFASLPKELGVSLKTAGPEHVLWFVRQHWLPRHTGTVLPDGSQVAAPSSLNGLLSALSTSFELLGRRGPWDEAARSGNPIHSKDITVFKLGYARQTAAAGFEEGSAIEWRESEVQQLVQGLDARAVLKLAEYQLCAGHGRTHGAQQALQEALLLDRDAFAVVYLWQSMQRGKEAGSLALDDFALPDGSALPQPLPFPLPNGFQVDVYPGGIKQHPGKRVLEPSSFVQQEGLNVLLQVPARLEQLMRLRREADRLFPGQQMAVQHYLICPSAKSRLGFEDRPLPTSALYNRIVKAAKELGLYRGQSLHGFRRGSLQHSRAQGASKEELSRQSRIQTEAVLDRYLNKRRSHVKHSKQERAFKLLRG